MNKIWIYLHKNIKQNLNLIYILNIYFFKFWGFGEK